LRINVDFKAVTEFSKYMSSESVQFELLSGKLLLIYGKGTPSDAHACLESVLTTFMGKSILYADLQKNFRGKLYLQDTPLHFSLSHTNDAFLLGVNQFQEIGIDLEGNVPPNEIDSLADYAFSPDERLLLDQFPGTASFLKIWTMKEAYLKATGTGMMDALSTLHVVSSPDFGVMDNQYSCLHFQCPSKETGSLVCRGTMPEVFCMLWGMKKEIGAD